MTRTYTGPQSVGETLKEEQGERMALKEFNLDGKVAIVTGGSRGIGKGIVLALAEAGADIVVVARSPNPVEQAAEEVRKMGRRSLPVPTDVTKADQVERMVEKTIAQLRQTHHRRRVA